MKKTGILGIVLVALAGLLGLHDSAEFFRSYLVAFLFWIAIPLGAMALKMIHNLTGGGWGKVLDPFFEAAIRTVPWILLFFVPVALGMNILYPWAHTVGHEAGHALTGFKAAYLTSQGFLLRAGIYLVIWLVLSSLLVSWGKQAQGREEAPAPLQGLSGVGLVLYVMTVTFASVDWAMSLDLYWFSTIYGALFMIGQGLAALSSGIIFTAFFSKPAEQQEQKTVFIHDTGNLLLAFVMLWAYMVLSQFLIIWSGNLPEEAEWYLVRFKGGWSVVGLIMLGLQFIIPFFLLLMRPLKRNPKVLARIAIIIFLIRFVELTWLLKPAFCPSVCLSLTDLMLWAGLGGIWIAVFFNRREASRVS